MPGATWPKSTTRSAPRPPPRPVRRPAAVVPPARVRPAPDPSPVYRPRRDPPRLVALYKTFSGPEFIWASLASVYPFVDGIVLVHSPRGWGGEGNTNTVAPVAEAWSAAHDHLGKVRHLYPANVVEQRAQYDHGVAAARDLFDPDFLLIVDADEVWDAPSLAAAAPRLAADRRHRRFTCGMRTYVKSPLYLVRPAEFCRPTAFVRVPPAGEPLDFAGVRGSGVEPTIHWPDVYFHHFTYVRDREEDVLAKVRASTAADGARLLDLAAWKRDKWDRLPGGAVDLHTTAGAEHSWARVVQVNPVELPAGLGDHPLVDRYAAEHRAAEDRDCRGVPPTSIVVPTCKSAAAIATLVEEVHRRATGTFEVIATCREKGSAAANRNAGLEAAGYDRVVMLDDDVGDLPVGFNRRLARHLDDEHVAMVSARLFDPEGRVGHLMGGAAFVAGEVTAAVEGKLATACVAFRKTGLRFDEGFVGSGWEDDDFAAQQRAADPAARFIVDNSVMVMHANEKKHQGPNFERNKRYFHRKWSGR